MLSLFKYRAIIKMINNIQKTLESLGLSAQKRALHIQFSNTTLNQQFYLQSIDGEHRLNQGAQAELLCLSTNATIALKQCIASQVAVDCVTDRGQLFRMTGLITGAEQGQSDGSLTIYKLKLEDPTALWKHRRNSRVFMNKSVVEIIEIVFKEWQQKSPIFAASLRLDLSGLCKDYDVRPFVMQHNETDDEFLKRLLHQEGINYLIDEAQLCVRHYLAPIEAQKLRLIDDNSQFKPLTRQSIRYHHSNATQSQDSIYSFVAQRSIQATAVHVQRWQSAVSEQENGAGLVLSQHKHSQNQDNTGLSLEQAWHFSPAWMQDLKGEDQATVSGNAQIERLNQNMLSAYELEAKQFIAQSSVRDAQVGYWFKFNGHPEIDQHDEVDQEFLITSKHFYNQNNLPKDLNEQVFSLIQQSFWSNKALRQQDERQANQLILQRRTIAVLPIYQPLQHRPIAFAQRAKVVGPIGEEIHVDEWGRIKVRFLFTRREHHEHDGGAGANDNDTDSAWIDVLTSWAGEGYGVRFLPRIGEIVVVDFFDGNIDRPFVVGRIHEGQRTPTQFDRIGRLPETKNLSGIRSKEVAGEGFGQLRFDDTPSQMSSQLQSSHATSQLNLGQLSHPKDSEKSDARGEGFELRTDQWGAVRAANGLLLSTFKQDQAKGEQVDAENAKQQLKSSQSNSKILSEMAQNHQMDGVESLENLSELIDSIKSDIAKFHRAMMLLSSPQDIALSSSDSLYSCAMGQINYHATGINLSTQKNLIAHAAHKMSLFAAQRGIKLVAAKKKLEIVAQDGVLNFLAQKQIEIVSTEDCIEIVSPKEISFIAGLSKVVIDGAGIEFITNQKFVSKAGQHLFSSGKKLVMAKPQFNRSPCFLTYEIVDDIGQPAKNIDYVIFKSDGSQTLGATDAAGRTMRIETDAPENISIHISDENASKYKIIQH